jgi:two-component system cell cycle sensor histidine kinase/response regulator CckA
MTDQDASKTKSRSQTLHCQREVPSASGITGACDQVAGDATTEGFFRVLFEKAAEGIMIVDPTTRSVVQVNPSLSRMFGYGQDRMTGMPVVELHPEKARPTVVSWFESHRHDFGAVTFEAECLAADGSVFVAALQVSLVEMSGRPYVVSFFTDITGRRRAEELVRVQRDLAQTLNATNDLDSALRACLTTVIAASNMNSGGIYLVDAVTGDVDLACSEGLSPEFVQGVAHYPADAPNTLLIRAGTPLYHSYVQLTHQMGTMPRGAPLRAMAVVPIKHDDRVIACLNVASHDLDEIPELARNTIETIAASIGSAIVRLRAEQAVHDSENRFRELTELLPQIVFELDAEGHVTYSNRRGFELTGLSQEDMQAGIHMLSLVSLPDRDKALENFRAIMSGATCADLELRLLRKDGSTLPGLIYGSPIFRDGATVGIRGIAVDITERERAANESRRQESLMQNVLESLPVGVWVTDGTGIIVSCNKAGRSIWQGARYVGVDQYGEYKGWWPATGKRIQADEWALARAITRGETSLEEEIEIECFDGTRKTILNSALPIRDAEQSVVGAIVVNQDITERKQIEVALNESEARYRHIVEASPFGMHMYRLESNGRLVFEGANPAGDWILKIDHSKLTGKTIEEAFPELVGTEVPEQYRCIARTGGRWRTEDITYEDSKIKGAFEVVAFQRSPMRMAAVFKDITERKLAEDELVRTKAFLDAAIEQSPAGILIAEAPDVKIVMANSAALGIRGATERPLTDIPAELHPINWQAYRPDGAMFRGEDLPLSRAVLEGVTSHNVEAVIRQADGSERFILANASPIRSKDGTITAGIVVFSDITELKRTESALREREARLSGIMLSAPIGIGIVSNRVLQHVNKTFCDMVGYTEDELINHSVAMLYLTGEEFDRVGLEYGQMASRGVSAIETVWRRKDSTTIEVILSVTPLDRSDWSKGITFTALDITERKRAESDLRTAEEQYRVLFERAGEGIMVASGEYFLLVNPAFCALSGYSLEDLASLKIRDFIHPDHREVVMDRYRRRQVGEQVPTGYDFKIVTKSGETRWVRINSTIINWQGDRASLNFVEDITVSRVAQEEIRKFKTISDTATYGTVITDMDGVLLYVNDALARMHDYRPEDLLGRNLAMLHSDEQQRIMRRISEGLIQTGSFTSTEVWHRRRDGTVFPTLMNGVVIHDGAGQPQFLAATAADISELKRLQEFADRAKRLEAAGRIAGQVAHDFNNLLGPLVAYPEFIKEEIGATHSANAYLDTMEAAAQQMADINQQLLSLGRRGHYNLEPLNLNEVIRQVLLQLQLQTERLEVVTELGGDLMNIKAGAAQIVRVLSNLISNSVDAMQGAGTLTITTQNWYADNPHGAYGQIEKGEYVKVAIADTGCGISEGIIGQVFEPFFTTKKADKKRGSGLGLSVVHAIVEDHGGYVDIESAEQQGTSVYLYFPITREEPTTLNDNQIIGGSETILLVDDDRIQQEVTTRLLDRLGYRVVVASSGEAAVQFLRRESADLVLLDMVMPGGMDGVETYRGILECRPGQKAVIVSGFAEEDKVAEARSLGAGEFLKKPLTLKSLAQTVRCELDRIPDLQPV